VHGARHDVACVIHTHTRAGMAVSAMKCGLLPLTQTAMRFGDITYHDYESVAIDLDERARLVADLGKSDAMILRNHGLLSAGPTIAQAFNTMYWLEMACRAQVDAMTSNTELNIPSADIAAKTAHLYRPEVRRPFGVMEWPAMLRYLDRRDSSYRE
jgi:ribulose-5-phosphate 4-epimerase/fuculose-1-phosphate aldolase